MRLGYITSTFPFGSGGPFFGPEIRALISLGHDVVVVPVWGRGERRSDACAVDEIRPWAYETLRCSSSRPMALGRALRSAVQKAPYRVVAKNVAAATSAVRLAQLVEQHELTHLHAAWASVPATVAMTASQLTACPWSFTAHRWDIEENNLLRQKLASASVVRFISAHGMDRAAAVTSLSPQQGWFVGHLGVDLPVELRPQPNGRVTVACVGALEPRKRHSDLIAALAQIDADRRPRLLLIGDGSLRESLQVLVEDLQLTADVTFRGHLPHEGVLSMYDRGEVHVAALVSESEGIPVSLMESMARGIPSVATRCGGISELVDDSNGRLVGVGDTAAIARALGELTVNADLRKRLGKAARNKVHAEFRVDVTARSLADRLMSV